MFDILSPSYIRLIAKYLDIPMLIIFIRCSKHIHNSLVCYDFNSYRCDIPILNLYNLHKPKFLRININPRILKINVWQIEYINLSANIQKIFIRGHIGTRIADHIFRTAPNIDLLHITGSINLNSMEIINKPNLSIICTYINLVNTRLNIKYLSCNYFDNDEDDEIATLSLEKWMFITMIDIIINICL